MSTGTSSQEQLEMKAASVDGKPPIGSDGKVRLEAKMTLLNGVAVIVGSIIGSGIFISPTGVLKYTGSSNMALVVWMLAGVFSMIGAYCYAELGCMITKTGADYAYIMVTFGRFLAFMRLWVESIIVRPGSQAAVALTFGIYILKPFYPECQPSDSATKLMALVSMLILTFVNCYSVKWSNKVQDVFTYAKLSALLLIIVTGIYWMSKGNVANFNWTNTSSDFSKIMLSFYAGLFAYNGWNYLNFIIEELKDPVRDLPRGIAISVLLVIFVYMLTNVAFFSTLNASDMLSSDAVGISFGNFHYGRFSWIIPVAVAMSTFGGLNGILLTSSRLCFAGAREGQMPKLMTMIQVKRLTPAPAVIFQTLLSVLYLFFPDVQYLIQSVGFATWLSIGVGVLCIPVLRYKQPELPRPIRVKLVWPIIYLIATVLIVVVPVYADPGSTGTGLLIILIGVPVYFLCFIWQNKPKLILQLASSSTEKLQKLMMVLAET